MTPISVPTGIQRQQHVAQASCRICCHNKMAKVSYLIITLPHLPKTQSEHWPCLLPSLSCRQIGVSNLSPFHVSNSVESLAKYINITNFTRKLHELFVYAPIIYMREWCKRQDLSCTYLAHHELESDVIIYYY